MLLKSNKQYFNCKSRIFPFSFSIYSRKPDGKYHNFRRNFNHINNNLYHYGANNPVRYIDPDGRSEEKAEIVQDPDQILKFESIIAATIIAHSDDKYIKSPNTDSDYRCDNYLEAIIDQSGGNSAHYLAGPAKDKDVQSHINNGLEKNHFSKNNKDSAPDLKSGYYATFMNDSNVISSKTGKPLEPHAGILNVNNDGTVSFSDNSSSNNGEKGGAETSFWSSVQNFQKNYGYRSFYYQKITK